MHRFRVRALSTQKKESRNLLRFILFSALLLLPGIALSGGVEHGSRAGGMGAPFAAISDDPSAMAHNPAGLAGQEGTNVYIGATAMALSTEYTGTDGSTEKTEDQIFYIPHMYFSTDLGTDTVAAGVGVFSPYGIGGRQWSRDWTGRYLSTKSETGTIIVNPSFAVKISPLLSVGVGVDYLWAYAIDEKMLDQRPLGAGDGELDIKGDGDGWGYNLGILLSFPNGFNIGAAYRSGIDITIEGDADVLNIAPAVQPLFGGTRFRTVARSTIDFPEIWSAGVSYRPSEKLLLGLDVDWFLWSSVHESRVDFEKEVPSAGFTDTVTEKDWKDIVTVKAGLEYMVRNNLALRFGYGYVQSPVPEHTVDPANAHSDQHNFSTGIGYSSEKLSLDMFYMAGFFEDRTVDNNILDGTYENFTQYAGASFGYRF